MATAYIVECLRTPGGRRNGRLSGWHPADLGAEAVDAVVERSGADPAAIDDLVLGCVTQAGEQAFAFARNVVLASRRLPETTPAVTIDRQCGSSQQAVQFAAQAVMSGVQDMVLAGGAESMSRVPMFSNLTLHHEKGLGEGPLSARIRARYGRDAFSQFEGAEMIARKYGFDREALDLFALESHRRAASATLEGRFGREMIPLEVRTEAGVEIHDRDEGVRYDATLDAMSLVRPVSEGGVVAPSNASQICDGASAALIVSEKALKQHGMTPIARIVNMTVTAGDPVVMLEEPIRATQRALVRAGLRLEDIDLFEVNEAFASVPMAWLKALDADPARLNVNGGAIALGHPLGASGTKLLATLTHGLRARGLRYGLQTMCEGGGMANVTIIEAL
ncbi:3-ketoacyl-CoA thiolase [compost metagenome]